MEIAVGGTLGPAYYKMVLHSTADPVLSYVFLPLIFLLLWAARSGFLLLLNAFWK